MELNTCFATSTVSILHFPFSSVQFQTALQITLSALRTILGMHDQLSFERNYEDLFVQTESFPFPFGNPALSLTLHLIFFLVISRHRLLDA